MTMGYEPTITGADLPPCDLAILGHYHWGKVLQAPMPAFYCGSMARIDFGEEGQDKMFWTFELDPSLPAGQRCTSLVPHVLDDRPFKTLALNIPASLPPEGVNAAVDDGIGIEEPDIAGAVVRMRINFGTAEQAAAFDQLAAEHALQLAGAWWVAGIERNAPQADRRWEGTDVAGAPPAEILRAYLAQSEPDEQRRGRLQDEGLALIGAGQQ
jgi:exonuclease SbcD